VCSYFVAVVIVVLFAVAFAVDAVILAVTVAADTSAVSNVGCTFSASVMLLMASLAGIDVVVVCDCLVLWCCTIRCWCMCLCVRWRHFQF
jgi:hypothetical protein